MSKQQSRPVSVSSASLRDEIGDFTGIPNDFMEDRKQTPESRLVFMFLRYHTNRKRKRAFPGYEKLILETGLSRQKVAAGIAKLNETGWLVKHKRFAETTEYELRYPATCLSSTMELREGAALVPLRNSSSSTMEQPPFNINNKIEFNKIDIATGQSLPRQEDSDEALDDDAKRYKIEELKDGSVDHCDFRKLMGDMFPSLTFSGQEDYYLKWWLSRVSKGGIGRRSGAKATLRQYAADMQNFFQLCVENNQQRGNGNGHKPVDSYHGPGRSTESDAARKKRENCPDCFSTGNKRVMKEIESRQVEVSVICKHENSTG